MAYVMNPNNFKLGYSLTWSDNWYSNNKLYPLMLHIMLNVRSLIGYFFYNKRIEKINIYLSHMNLGLTSGCLFISLFFYDTRIDYRAMNYSLKLYQYSLTPQTYRHHYKFFRKKLWKKRNKSTMFNWHLRDMFMRYTWWNTLLTFRPDTDKQFNAIYKSQNFFLFFQYLGLSPDVLLLEYYQRNYFKFRRYLINRIINKKRLFSSNKWMYICARETSILYFFYRFLLNDKLSFDWLNKSKDNDVLNLTRILRYLFFYSRMPYWNRRHITLTLPRKDKYIQNHIKSLNLRKTNKKYLRNITYNKFLKIRKKNTIKLNKKKKKFKIKNLLSMLFVKLFLGKIVRLNQDIINLELENVKVPKYIKSKNLKKKYKVLLKKVKNLVKRSNFLSFFFFFNLVDKTYKGAKARVDVLKRQPYYPEYSNYEGLREEIKEFNEKRELVEKADINVVSDIEIYIKEYFRKYYQFLPYFSFLETYQKEKNKWKNFLLAYEKLYRTNYKWFFRNLRNNNKDLNIKKQFKKTFFYMYEKDVISKYFKKRPRSFYNKKPKLLKKNDIDYLNKMKLSIKFKKRELKEKKKQEELKRQKRLTVNETLMLDKDGKLDEEKEKIKSLFKDLFESLQKQKNFKAYNKYKKRRKLSPTVHYGFDIYKFFNKRFMYIKSTTKEKMRSEFKTMHVVRFSYARLFFMLWILNLNTQFKKMAPYRLIEQGYYKRLSIYESIYLFYFILIKRPFLKKFSTYIGLLIKKWLGLNSKFNFYIITNNEITSSYIARHIAYAFKLGFDWRNVVKPIKKDLNFLLTQLKVLEYGTKSSTYNSFKNWIEKDKKDFFFNTEVFFKMYKKRYIGYIVQSFKYSQVKIFFFNFWKNKFFSKKFKVSTLRSYFYLAKKFRNYFIDYMFEKRYLKLYIWNISYFMDILQKLKVYSYYFFKLNTIKHIIYPNNWPLKKLNKLNTLRKYSLARFFKNKLTYRWIKWLFWNFLFKNYPGNITIENRNIDKYLDSYDLSSENNFNIRKWWFLKREIKMEIALSRVWRICLNNFKLIYYFFLFRNSTTFFSLSNLKFIDYNKDTKLYIKIFLEFYNRMLSYLIKFFNLFFNLKKLKNKKFSSFKINNLKLNLIKLTNFMLNSEDTYLKRYRLFATTLAFLVKREYFKITDSLLIWKKKFLNIAPFYSNNLRYFDSNYLYLHFLNYFKGVVVILVKLLDRKLGNLYKNLIIKKFKLKYKPRIVFWENLVNEVQKPNYYIWLNFMNFLNFKNIRYLFVNLNKYVYFSDTSLDVFLKYKKHHRNLIKSISYKKLYWNKQSNLLKKKTYIDYFFKNRSILGYKFRLAGRFRRRRKRSIVWIKKGLLPIASHEKFVDYGQSITANEYSTFSVRVWIHRNQNFTHKYFLKF